MKKRTPLGLGLLGLLAQGPVLYLSVMESEGLLVPQDIAAAGMAASAIGLTLVALGGTAVTGEFLVRCPRPPKVLIFSFALTLTIVCGLVGFHRAARLAGIPVLEVLQPQWIQHNWHILAYGHLLPLLFELALFSCVVVAGANRKQDDLQDSVDDLEVQLALARGQAERFDEIEAGNGQLVEENANLRSELDKVQAAFERTRRAAARLPEVLDARILEVLAEDSPLTVGDLVPRVEVPPDTIRQALRRLGDRVVAVPHQGPGKARTAYVLPPPPARQDS